MSASLACMPLRTCMRNRVRSSGPSWPPGTASTAAMASVAWLPVSMRLASSTSSSPVSRGTLPISFR